MSLREARLSRTPFTSLRSGKAGEAIPYMEYNQLNEGMRLHLYSIQ